MQAIQRWPRQAAIVLIALIAFGAVNAFVAGKFASHDPVIGDSRMEGTGHIGVSDWDGKVVCIVATVR